MFDRKSLIVGLSSILVILTILTPEKSISRYIFAVPLILFLPGYVLQYLIFPQKFDILSMIVISTTLSFVIVALIAFILALINHLTFLFSILTLYMFIFVCCILHYLISQPKEKEEEEEKEEEKEEERKINISLDFSGLKLDKTFICILIVCAIITGYSFYIVATPKYPKYTEFYLLNNDRTINIPKNVNIGDTIKVIVGVVNKEGTETKYNVTGRFGTHIILDDTVKLSPGKKKEWNVNISLTTEGKYKLEFLLYKNNEYFDKTTYFITVRK